MAASEEWGQRLDCDWLTVSHADWRIERTTSVGDWPTAESYSARGWTGSSATGQREVASQITRATTEASVIIERVSIGASGANRNMAKKKAENEVSADSATSAVEYSSDESVAMATDCALSSNGEGKSVKASRNGVGVSLSTKKTASAPEDARDDGEEAGCSAWRTVSRRGTVARTEEDRESARVPAESSDRAARKRPAASPSSDGGETTDEEATARRKLKRKNKPASPVVQRKQAAVAAKIESAPRSEVDTISAKKKDADVAKDKVKGTTLSKISEDAGRMAAEVMAYCLDDTRKIGKTQASYIMTRVMAMNELLREALMRNSFLEGRLVSAVSCGKSAEPVRQQAPAARPTVNGSAKKSFAEVAADKAAPASSAPALQAPTARKSKLKSAAVIAAAESAPKAPCNEVLIVPTEAASFEDSEATKKAILAAINPTTAGIRVKAVRKAANKGVVVVTETAKDLAKFMENPTLSSAGLLVSRNAGNMPRVLVYDVPREMAEGSVAETIRRQNFDDIHASKIAEQLKMIFRTGTRDKDTVNCVFEATPELRKRMLNKGRVYVGWGSCRVRDFLEASRCYKCQSHGHIAKMCRVENDVCAHCAVSGHDVKECPSKERPATCVNCKKAGRKSKHAASSKSCPSYTAALERKAMTINYG